MKVLAFLLLFLGTAHADWYSVPLASVRVGSPKQIIEHFPCFQIPCTANQPIKSWCGWQQGAAYTVWTPRSIMNVQGLNPGIFVLSQQEVQNQRPSMSIPRYEARCGPVPTIGSWLEKLWRFIEPTLAWALGSSDNFNRTENPLASGWGIAWTGYGWDCQANGTAVVTSGSTLCWNINNSYVSAANQSAQVTFSDFSADDGRAGVSIRTTLDVGGYVCDTRNYGNDVRIRTYDGATFTTVASNPATFTTGDTFKCEISGSDLTVSQNGGTVLTYTDPGPVYATGQPGIYVDYDSSTTGGVAVDSWVSTDLGGAPARRRVGAHTFQ